MFLRKAALVFFLATFLAVPHDVRSGGWVSFVMAVLQIALIVGYTADVIDDFIRIRDTSRKLRNYLWLAIPIVTQIVYVEMNNATMIALFWLGGVAVILMLKMITGGRMTGNSDKIVDGIMTSGFPVG